MARGSAMKKKGYSKKPKGAHRGGRAAALRSARKPKIPMGGLKFGGAAPNGLMA